MAQGALRGCGQQAVHLLPEAGATDRLSDPTAIEHICAAAAMWSSITYRPSLVNSHRGWTSSPSQSGSLHGENRSLNKLHGASMVYNLALAQHGSTLACMHVPQVRECTKAPENARGPVSAVRPTPAVAQTHTAQQVCLAFWVLNRCTHADGHSPSSSLRHLWRRSLKYKSIRHCTSLDLQQAQSVPALWYALCSPSLTCSEEYAALTRQPSHLRCACPPTQAHK